MAAFHRMGLELHRSFHIRQYSKFLLFMIFPVVSLLLLPLLNLESTLVLRLWVLFGRLFEGSTSVFLLLNGVVATIIASSKVEQSIAKGAFCSKKTTVEKKIVLSTEKGTDFQIGTAHQPVLANHVTESFCTAGNQENPGSSEEIPERVQTGQQSLLYATNFSNTLQSDDPSAGEMITSDTQLCQLISYAGEDGNYKSSDAARLAPPSSEEVWSAIEANYGGDLMNKSNRRLPEPNDEKSGRLEGSATTHQQVNIQVGGGVDSGSSAPVSVEEAPSAEAVWAAIVAAKKGGPPTTAVEQKGGAAEPNATFANAVVPTRIVKAGNSSPALISRSRDASRPPAPAESKKKGEVEDLNRRAEEFIARVTERMRLQRLESLRLRRSRRRGVHHLQRRRSKGAARPTVDGRQPLPAADVRVR